MAEQGLGAAEGALILILCGGDREEERPACNLM